MDVIRELTINASKEKLWQIMAKDYNKVDEWTTEVHESRPNPTLNPGEGRVCTTPNFGDITETILELNDQTNTLSYSAVAPSMPFFVKDITNTWNLTSLGDSRTKVKMHIRAKLLPIFSGLMGPMMKKRFAKAGERLLEELQYYSEKGVPHPRKMQQIEQMQLHAT